MLHAKVFSRVNSCLLVSGIMLLCLACSDDFMSSDLPSERTAAMLVDVSESAGSVNATLSSSSKAVQVLNASAASVVAGSTLSLPPGALAIDVNVSIGPGEELSNISTAQQLGISGSVAAAGPSVAFLPSTDIEATKPFTLAIPLAGAALQLQASNDDLAVMYKVIAVVGGVTSYYIGVMPRSQISVSGKTVTFQTQQFGVFQVVRAAGVTAIKVQSYEPVVPKLAASPLVGTWRGTCEQRYKDHDDQASNGQASPDGGGECQGDCGGWPGYRDPSISTYYTLEGVKFSATAFAYYEEVYTTSDCSGSFFVRKAMTGEYKLGTKLTNGSEEFDLYIKTTSHAIGTVPGVTDANAQSLCGHGDWQIGVPRSTGGTDCDRSMDAGRIQYDLIKIEAGKLYFGDAKHHEIDQPELRPTEIDFGRYWSKVE